jgi:hypothetical protein
MPYYEYFWKIVREVTTKGEEPRRISLSRSMNSTKTPRLLPEGELLLLPP